MNCPNGRRPGSISPKEVTNAPKVIAHQIIDFKGLKHDIYSREFKSPFKSYSLKYMGKDEPNKRMMESKSTQLPSNPVKQFSKTMKFHCPHDRLFGLPPAHPNGLKTQSTFKR